MYVKTFKTDIIILIGNNQFIDIDNITP